MIRPAFFVALLAAGLLAASPVSAQQSPPAPTSGVEGRGHRHNQDRPSDASSPPHRTSSNIRPEPWPRLDPGAVFCRSAEDLQQRAQLIRAQLDGGPPAPTSTSACPLVRTPTPVEVMERRGPGQTQVRVKADGTVGWTDVYLPEKTPH